MKNELETIYMYRISGSVKRVFSALGEWALWDSNPGPGD
jgi:hypothetical protein